MKDNRLGCESVTFVVTMSKRGGVARAGCLCLLAGWAAMMALNAIAQQAAPAAPQNQETPWQGPPKPETEKQQQEQQPGSGAQVHTGTSSGIDADVRLQNLLADHQYFRVADELDQLPPSRRSFIAASWPTARTMQRSQSNC